MTTAVHEKIPLKDLEAFLQSLPLIKTNMETIVARRKKEQAAAEMPMTSGNPTVEVQAPAAPTKQPLNMSVK